ncbi:endonuclease domain-containing protein [Sphingobacterium cellulitidis]|uniref:endonuclease domain-containing protein n=1 Tax=Sphingobacterium cellulitidis TaxID=1768011 RepID=UPI000B93CDA7|nr:hypothetical protein CHT99_15600 [Sphingobacterium cellulitidis]
MGKWGRPGQGKSIIHEIVKKNYVLIDNVYYPPSSPKIINSVSPKNKRSKIIRTGWTDDSRNIKNKEKHKDAFIRFIEMELGLEVWPEFHFSIERNYRLDYAIPEFKIAIEVDGGIWMKGNSGHSSGKGIKRDMDKGNLLQLYGWKTIRIEPNEIVSDKVLESIKTLMNNSKV